MSNHFGLEAQNKTMRQKIPSVGWSYLKPASGEHPPNHTSRIIQCRLAPGPLLNALFVLCHNQPPRGNFAQYDVLWPQTCDLCVGPPALCCPRILLDRAPSEREPYPSQ